MLRSCERFGLDPLRFLYDYPQDRQTWVLAYNRLRQREEAEVEGKRMETMAKMNGVRTRRS